MHGIIERLQRHLTWALPSTSILTYCNHLADATSTLPNGCDLQCGVEAEAQPQRRQGTGGGTAGGGLGAAGRRAPSPAALRQ